MKKKKKKKLKLLSPVRLCATPWTAAHQAPPFMGFSRQEHWNAIAFSTSQSGLPYGSNGKESAYNAGDLDLIPAEGNGYPLQYSCLENCVDREAWWTAVHGVEEPDTSTFTPVWSLPQTLLVLPYGTSVPTSVQAHYCSALSIASFAWSLTPVDVQMANRHVQRCSTSLIVKRHANQNYNEVSPHIGQMAIIKKSTNNKCWRGCGEKGILLHCW